MTLRPFEQIVAEYGPLVLRVCRALLGPVDAEDAWSETFLSALKAYPALPLDANVRGWLVTIAHRRAIDVVRARTRSPVPVAEVPEPTDHDDPPRAGPWDPEGWDEQLWAALTGLPERQRTAVAYHYLAGLPYKEIAAITGGSTDAARRAAADGIQNLRADYRCAPSPQGATP